MGGGDSGAVHFYSFRLRFTIKVIDSEVYFGRDGSVFM